jgi:hypothetical protein
MKKKPYFKKHFGKKHCEVNVEITVLGDFEQFWDKTLAFV